MSITPLYLSNKTRNYTDYAGLPPPEDRGNFQPISELITLENKAMEEYEGHHTNLTGFDT